MKYIIVCGPTCSGKTSLAVKLARRYNSEIISADSRQVFRQTNIGTAKPSPEEQGGIKHHLVDILNLDEHFSAYKFAEMAKAIIKDLVGKKKVPIIAGGTGLYLRALTEGLFKTPEPDYEYRAELEDIARQKGVSFLHDMLAGVDPQSAARINPGHLSRIVRALEIFKLTGRPISELQKKGDYNKIGMPLWLGLMPARKILYERINRRVDEMIEKGFEQEVLGLKPFLDILRKRKIVGYSDMISYLFDKEISRDTAIEKVKQHHRNYAKRQITWFKKIRGVIWFDPYAENYIKNVFAVCDKFLKKA